MWLWNSFNLCIIPFHTSYIDQRIITVSRHYITIRKLSINYNNSNTLKISRIITNTSCFSYFSKTSVIRTLFEKIILKVRWHQHYYLLPPYIFHVVSCSVFIFLKIFICIDIFLAMNRAISTIFLEVY